VNWLPLVDGPVRSLPPVDGPVRTNPHVRAPWRAVIRSRRGRGSATVAVVGVVGVLLAMVVGALMVISAVVASHQARSAADLAALGAAAVLVRGEPAVAACSTAGAVASRNGAALATCQTDPDLSVEIEVRVPATMPHVGVASARSRAGPSP
jgi:secretion/DNA translocation related TadE-like protein